MPVVRAVPRKTHVTLLIGASGSIGQKLCAGLLEAFGDFTVIAAIRRTPLPTHLASRTHVVTGVDIRKPETLQKIFDEHPNMKVTTVWNLAAPLSVDTAKDPQAAHDITVGGMERLLKCCLQNGVSKERTSHPSVSYTHLTLPTIYSV